jgi:hypothetical protein
MTYTIEVLDITNRSVEDELRMLLKEAFDMPELPPPGYIYQNTMTKASNPSIFLAAVEDGKIIGCNCFIAIDFFTKETTYTCYQSCWSATHPKHQGKKVFVNTINYAKEYLKAKGGGFIFGMPNDKSYPIFLKKLGFSERPALITRIPNIPIVKSLFFKNSSLAIKQVEADTLLVTEMQVIALKQQENREPIEVVSVNESYAWGKIKNVKKFGINIRYFYLGGIFLKKPTDYKKLVDKIFSQHRVLVIQIVSDESNSWNGMVKHWKKASMNGFIYFDLNGVLKTHVNIMNGIIDVF